VFVVAIPGRTGAVMIWPSVHWYVFPDVDPYIRIASMTLL
jgi:hypothetical protein